MTTTGSDPDDGPVLRLLNVLLKRDDERKGDIAELRGMLTKLEMEAGEGRSFRERTRVDIEQIKGSLERQDGQYVALDQRISGNYRGQTAQLDTMLTELKEISERARNMERAIVENHRDTQTLHGSLIEEADRLGRRAKQDESIIDTLSKVASENKARVEVLGARMDRLEGLQEAAAVG